MKSTDMFLSADSRKTPPQQVILPEEKTPKGRSYSPHTISLWSANPTTKKIRKIQPQKDIKEKVQKPLPAEKTPNTTEDIPEILGDFSLHDFPETTIEIPSREDQIQKVKNAMKQFEELSKMRSNTGDKGFFRNLKNILS